jgi:hypothetical protein
LYAVASIWHYTSSANVVSWSWLHFDPIETPSLVIAITTAFIAACYPSSMRAFVLMIAAQAVIIFIQLPFTPTHLVMELFLALCILASYGHLALRQRSWAVDPEACYALFSPAGRLLLLCMYFFGTFHKINPGFLSLHSSCAIDFITGLPLPNVLIETEWFRYTAIYAVLVLEFVVLLLLLSARTKYLGMLLGIPFHIAIGISSYGSLAHFSAFVLALHALFLPDSFADRLLKDNRIPAAIKTPHAIQFLTVIIVITQMLFAFNARWTLMNTLFGVFAIMFFTLILRHGKYADGDNKFRLLSPFRLVNALPLLFFLHCCGPYIGLSTGGAVQMFSGLRTEGGISNHYLIRTPPYLFPYQRDVVYIESSSDDYLRSLIEADQGLTLIDFHRFLATRDAPVSLPLVIAVNGNKIEIDDAESARAFEEEFLGTLNMFEFKLLIFRDVDAPNPKRCRH